MKQKMVVTNLRIPQENWLQVKATAAAEGKSVNEYINTLIVDSSRQTFFGFPKVYKPIKKSKKRDPYSALLELATKPYTPHPLEASEDDKAIYGIDDE